MSLISEDGCSEINQPVLELTFYQLECRYEILVCLLIHTQFLFGDIFVIERVKDSVLFNFGMNSFAILCNDSNDLFERIQFYTQETSTSRYWSYIIRDCCGELIGCISKKEPLVTIASEIETMAILGGLQ